MPDIQSSDDNEVLGFRITLQTPRGTEPYEIRLEDFSALDEAAFSRAVASVTGQNITLFEAFERISTVTVAAFIWLTRRRSEKQLTIQEVMKEVYVRDLKTFEELSNEDEQPKLDSRDPEPYGEPSALASPGSPPSMG